MNVGMESEGYTIWLTGLPCSEKGAAFQISTSRITSLRRHGGDFGWGRGPTVADQGVGIFERRPRRD